MFSPIDKAIRGFGDWYIRKTCRAEYDRQFFHRHRERPIEFAFALRALADARPKTVLDVGTGTTAWPHLLRNCGFVVTAVDNVRDFWPEGMINRHWTILDVDIVNGADALTERYDAITCISVLEHIEDHAKAVANMAHLLAPGGILILTTPYSAQHPYPNVYEHPDAVYGKDFPYKCRSSSQVELQQWLKSGLRIERRELWKMFTGPMWDTGALCDWEEAPDESAPHQLGCFVFSKQSANTETR